MELVNRRPADETGRLEKEIRVYDLLDSLGISYQRVDILKIFLPAVHHEPRYVKLLGE